MHSQPTPVSLGRFFFCSFPFFPPKLEVGFTKIPSVPFPRPTPCLCMWYTYHTIPNLPSTQHFKGRVLFCLLFVYYYYYYYCCCYCHHYYLLNTSNLVLVEYQLRSSTHQCRSIRYTTSWSIRKLQEKTKSSLLPSPP